ncbi:hypothetical protein ES708_18682 [subsurface metagenome]
MENVWKYIGELKNRIRVYLSPDGAYVVSRDDDIRYLPTGEELEEIHRTYGSGEVKRGKTEKAEENGRMERVVALMSRAQLFEAEIADLKNVIDAMRKAIKARDELCDALTEDLTAEKKQNLRWEGFAHAAMKQQAELLGKLEAAGIRHGKED